MPRMNTKANFTILLAAAFTAICSGADVATIAAPSVAPTDVPHALTNMLSDWTVQWTNLTVTAPCPPWGCSRVIVLYEGTDHRPPISPKKREAMQQLAKRLEALKQEERIQERLRAPAFSEAFGVSLRKFTNSSGQAR
jgi:hypothetical protein